MKASAQDGLVTLVLDEAEYRLVTNSLRELVGEMHEKDFPPRIGASRDAVFGLAMRFREELENLGIEE